MTGDNVPTVQSDYFEVRTFLHGIISSITKKKMRGLLPVYVGYHMQILLNSGALSVADKHDQFV